MLKRFWENLTRSKYSTSSAYFVIPETTRQWIWPSWPWIGLRTFEFSATTARISTKRGTSWRYFWSLISIHESQGLFTFFLNMCLFNSMAVAGSARAKVGLVNQLIAPVWWLLLSAQPLCNGIFLWHLWCCFVFRIMLCVPFGTLSYYQYWVRSPSSCLYRKQVLNVFCQVYASVGRSVNKYGRNAIWLAGTF